MNDTVIPMPSPIHGVGLFAIQGFFKGDQVLPKGNLVTIENHQLMEKPRIVQDLWMFYGWQSKDKKRWIRPTDDNPARFVNHSSKPNVINVAGVLIALDDIEPGMEILEQYHHCSVPDQLKSTVTRFGGVKNTDLIRGGIGFEDSPRLHTLFNER